jgi:hypothetical protein
VKHEIGSRPLEEPSGRGAMVRTVRTSRTKAHSECSAVIASFVGAIALPVRAVWARAEKPFLLASWRISHTATHP